VGSLFFAQRALGRSRLSREQGHLRERFGDLRRVAAAIPSAVEPERRVRGLRSSDLEGALVGVLRQIIAFDLVFEQLAQLDQ
jgi:hypothetical protein